MPEIIKPDVTITNITPSMPFEGITHIGYHIKSFSGEIEGYMEIEFETVKKYIGNMHQLVVDELIKDLQGVEIKEI